MTDHAIAWEPIPPPFAICFEDLARALAANGTCVMRLTDRVVDEHRAWVAMMIAG